MISMYSPREQAADRRNHSPEAERYRRDHGLAPCAGLARAEAAYAHLASFQRGQLVDVESRTICYPAVVMVPQQHDWSDINRAYLVVSNQGTEIRITVGQLLAGHYRITPVGEPGNIRYFDPAGYAAQNPEA